MKTIIAIDPGASGGVAIFDGETKEVRAYSMPQSLDHFIIAMRDIETRRSVFSHRKLGVRALEDVSYYLEKVGGYVGEKQPGSAMFVFGRGVGQVEGVMRTLGFVGHEVTPQEWQKGVGVGTRRQCATKVIWKNKLKEAAQARFPEIKVTLSTSDALLILDWAIRRERFNERITA